MSVLAEFFKMKFFGFSMLDYTFIFIVILAAFAAKGIIDYILKHKLKPLAEKSKTTANTVNNRIRDISPSASSIHLQKPHLTAL